jgi:hypothetical protein
LFPEDDVKSKRFAPEVFPQIKLNTLNSQNASIVYDDVSKQIFICDTVNARGLQPVQVNDFTRGVHVISVPVYALCLAYQNETISDPWDSVQFDVENQSQSLVIAYAVIILSILLIFFLFIYKVSILSVSCFVFTTQFQSESFYAGAQR